MSPIFTDLLGTELFAKWMSCLSATNLPTISLLRSPCGLLTVTTCGLLVSTGKVLEGLPVEPPIHVCFRVLCCCFRTHLLPLQPSSFSSTLSVILATNLMTKPLRTGAFLLSGPFQVFQVWLTYLPSAHQLQGRLDTEF